VNGFFSLLVIIQNFDFKKPSSHYTVLKKIKIMSAHSYSLWFLAFEGVEGNLKNDKDVP
jgi:hypothetical protein